MNGQNGDKRIRLLIVDDQALFRTSLARWLAQEPGFEVVAECDTCASALDALHASPVDVLLLDSTVGSENTSDFMAAARCVGDKGQFLIITETASVKESATALKVGATGIFSKSEAPDRLIQAIRLVAAGAVWVDQKILQLLLDQCPDPHDRAGNPKFSRLLEDREEKVIQGILGGHTTKRIGNNLDLSESAVRNIFQRLFAKTGVRKRSQLVKLALEGSLGTSFAGAKTAGAAAAPADR